MSAEKNEAAHAEALRRIREAEKNGATRLDLSRLDWLCQLPQELGRLKSLQTLDLSYCKWLRGDLSPLANLTLLQTLNLCGCWELRGDLSPLASLTSLQTLDLERCGRLTDLSPLVGLTSLRTLNLGTCVYLKGDLRPLTGLTSLQTLNLSGSTWLTDLSPLTGLTSIRALDLSVCWHLRGDLSPLAGLKSLQALDLSVCFNFTGDLGPLASLTSLQTLNLSRCSQFRGDLSPLAGLTSLRTLDLSECEQLVDLSPLAGLTSLQSLNLSRCSALRQFDPVRELLSSLQKLYLFGCKFNDLPSEVCGESRNKEVLAQVRAHYEDLNAGRLRDAEVKVLFLGNGGTGKTQLCRRLRGEPFDPSVPSTHSIQLNEKAMELEEFPEPVRLNLWDFGGQEVYHGSQALFLQGQAVFLILWTPKLEQGSDCEGDLTFQRRPLRYWLDYLRPFAGNQSSALIIQSQCDRPSDRVSLPPGTTDDLAFFGKVEVSALTGLGLGLLGESLKEAVRDCLYRRPPPPIGLGRVRVRDRLRRLLAEDQKCPAAQRRHQLLGRVEFDRLCDDEGGISDKGALLDFLHHSGVIFYRPSLFGGQIVLDQNWALEAIYGLFDRKKILPLLRGYGRISRADLETLIWSRYTPEEQKIFLGMMETCGICFKARKLSDNEWESIAPELLPKWSDAQELLLGRLRDDPPDARATARYTFLHEGVLRSYLSKLGEHAKDAAIYWKYGCWFYEQTTHSQVLIESNWEDAASEAGAGDISLRAWGQNAESLINALLETLQSLPIGQAPRIEQTKRIRVQAFVSSSASVVTRLVQNPLAGDAASSSHGDADMGDKADGLSQLQITDRSEDLPAKGTQEIFISYAWGDNSSEDARKRGEVVEQLYETLCKEGWNIIRDKNAMRSGDLISGFMKRIGLADRVIVVLSDKYLRSAFCMTELHSIYQRSLEEKEDFLRRIVPLTLEDVRIRNRDDRLAYAQHWKQAFERLDADFADPERRELLGEGDFAEYRAMRQWYTQLSDMLRHINDVLHPHGFEAMVKEFRSLAPDASRVLVAGVNGVSGLRTRNGNLSTLRRSVSLVEGSSKARHEKH